MKTAVITIMAGDYLPGRRIPSGVLAVRFTLCGPEALVEEVAASGVVVKRELVSRERALGFLRAHTHRGSSGGLGRLVPTIGRSVHPLHPMHPYRNGPAVWGGRQLKRA